MAIMQQRSFVLVPGAGGNAEYWQLVQPLIREAGFSSTAVPLPNWPGATFSDHADAIVAAAGAPNQVILVAQSMPTGITGTPARITIRATPVLPL